MDYKKILISTGVLTLVVWGIFLVLGLLFGWFSFTCVDCPNMGSVFFAYSFVLLPLWMLVVFGGVFLAEYFHHK